MNVNGIDYICITDIAKQKNSAEPKDVVKNWMRQKNTLEYLGLWEKLNNPNFKGVEFDPLLAEAGSNAFTMSPTRWVELTSAIGIIIYAEEADVLNVAMFGMTAKQWREANPELKGNIRDYTQKEPSLLCTNPLMVQSLEKNRRNYILKSTKDYGAGIRQLSRLTGVSYGVIQKL